MVSGVGRRRFGGLLSGRRSNSATEGRFSLMERNWRLVISVMLGNRVLICHCVSAYVTLDITYNLQHLLSYGTAAWTTGVEAQTGTSATK